MKPEEDVMLTEPREPRHVKIEPEPPVLPVLEPAVPEKNWNRNRPVKKPTVCGSVPVLNFRTKELAVLKKKKKNLKTIIFQNYYSNSNLISHLSLLISICHRLLSQFFNFNTILKINF
ncbi:MAG: hypothetical protein Q8881_03000 [Sweet potato little leaf phytoplasma]|nr:hypothetical protein [Sweet potato little leaf phytoplasma]